MKERGRVDFEWQEGYFACSVSRSQVATIRQYIANQKAHHHKMTFEAEFRLLAKNTGLRFRIEARGGCAVPYGDSDLAASFPGTPCRALDWAVPRGTMPRRPSTNIYIGAHGVGLNRGRNNYGHKYGQAGDDPSAVREAIAAHRKGEGTIRSPCRVPGNPANPDQSPLRQYVGPSATL